MPIYIALINTNGRLIDSPSADSISPGEAVAAPASELSDDAVCPASAAAGRDGGAGDGGGFGNLVVDAFREE